MGVFLIIRFLLRRIAFGLVIVFVMSFALYTLISLAPGDIVTYILGYEHNTPKGVAMREALGLDRPLPIRYFSWLRELLDGNWGTTHIGTDEVGSIRKIVMPVKDFLLQRLPYTLGIAGAALALSIVLTMILLYVMSRSKNRIVDIILSVFSLTGISFPAFWIAGMAIVICSRDPNLHPYIGASNRVHLMSGTELFQYGLIPTLLLTMMYMSINIRYLRASMREIMSQDYITMARSKGLSEVRVITAHGLRNALMPFITTFSLTIPALISEIAVIETVFKFPGLGFAYIEASYARDYSLLMGLFLTTTVLVVVTSIAADICYALADPRIKYS